MARTKRTKITKREDGVTHFTVDRDGKAYECLIDTSDEHLLINNSYRLHGGTDGRQYLARSFGRSVMYLHRELMGDLPKGYEVDHVNRNKRDNRKRNLRACTSQQNSVNQSIASRNTSGYKGVTYMPRDKNWTARVQCQGKRVFAGYHRCPTLAALAYDKIATELHGEFANLNLPGLIEGGAK